MELVVRKAESDEWIAAKEMERISLLNEVVCGLSDFCAEYKIGLRIVETTLPESSAIFIIPLTSVGPVGFEELQKVRESGMQNINLEGPKELAALNVSPNTIALKWNNTNKRECMTGYMIQVKNHGDLNQLGILL